MLHKIMRYITINGSSIQWGKQFIQCSLFLFALFTHFFSVSSSASELQLRYIHSGYQLRWAHLNWKRIFCSVYLFFLFFLGSAFLALKEVSPTVFTNLQLLFVKLNVLLCEFTTTNLYLIKNVHEMALYLFLVYILEAFIFSLSFFRFYLK